MAPKWKAPVNEASAARPYVALIFDDPANYTKVGKELEGFFGTADFESQAFNTDGQVALYGGTGRRLIRFMSFKRPVGREELVDMRRKTLNIEANYQGDGRPLVELDPGYVSAFNVVRSSLEENFHRIYLYHGIFGESLLYFENHGFRPLLHTPDFFRKKEIVTVFNDLRLIFQSDP